MALNMKTGTMLVLFTALVSGFSIFINSFAVKGFDSSVFTFAKNVVVAVLLLAIIIGLGQLSELRQLTKRQWSWLVLIGLVGGSIPFLLFFKGLQMTTGSTASFIHKTLFIFMTIFAVMFLKEKLTRWMLAGSALLLAGTYLMIRPDFGLSTGHLLVLAAVVLWAAENTIAKHVLGELSGTVVAFGRMFFGSVFILAFLILTNKAALAFSMTYPQYVWIIVTSIFLLLYVLSYYNGLKHISASTAGCILALGAPITAVLSLIFNGAAISAADAAGMLLILAGVVVITWSATATKYVLDALKALGVNRDA